MDSKKTIGAVCAIVGVIGAIFAYSTMNEEISTNKLFSGYGGYTYKPPYTSHEQLIMTVLAGGIILAIVGFAFLIMGFKNSGQSEKDDTNGRTDTDIANELKKYKELLDSGVITQEEYDKKRKQLLGL